MKLQLQPLFDTEDSGAETDFVSEDLDAISEGEEEATEDNTEEPKKKGESDEEEEGPAFEEEEIEAEEEKPKKKEKAGSEESEEEEEIEPEPEGEEESEKVNGRTSLKAIKAKYPDLFKTFPDLRDAFFREREFSKHFGSVDDAQEAISKAGYYDSFADAVDKGDIGMIMDAVIETGEEQAKQFVENFLPALEQRSVPLLSRITTPFVHRAIRYVYNDGVKMGGDRGQNLQLAAKYMALHLFNEKDPSKLDGTFSRPSPEKQQLETERKNFASKQLDSAVRDVERGIDNRLKKEVTKSVDPNNTMNDFTRDALVEKVVRELHKVVIADKAHITRMNSLWRRATREEYISDSKSRIIFAYLARAKQSLPSVVAKVKMQAKTNKKQTVENKNVPDQRASGQKQTPRSGRVDYARTSDMDILNDNIAYVGQKKR